MMKSKTFLMALVIVLMLGTLAYAGNKNDLAYLATDELDTATSVGVTDEILVVQSGIPKQGMTVSDVTKVKIDNVRVKTTTRNTTILASETGKTFICTANSKFQLPAAADGLNYKFITVGLAEVEIQVSTTPDTIKLAGPGDGDGSQGVIETGVNTTGNTISLVSDGTSWYANVEPLLAGAWVDGGVWVAFTAGENE